ncbi:MAG TPA: phage tail protein [Bryobacteraceae bacterium]|nr:phage tail protein [Bryobacteraceae bacterium]
MRNDPYRGFRFRVEFNQVQHGGFSRVKGLVRETKFESRREGGVNDYEHKLATQTTYGNLILERGLVDEYLWSWHDAVVEGSIERRTITVALHDEADQEVWRWLVERAFPVKWAGTDLDALATQVVVESIELAHEGIRKA